MLGPSWIPTKLSAEARSRPFEAPVITDFLANPGAERGRDIDKEGRGGNSKGEREIERERLNDCYVLRMHWCRAWAPRMNRAIAAATKLPPLSSPLPTKGERTLVDPRLRVRYPSSNFWGSVSPSMYGMRALKVIFFSFKCPISNNYQNIMSAIFLCVLDDDSQTCNGSIIFLISLSISNHASHEMFYFFPIDWYQISSLKIKRRRWILSGEDKNQNFFRLATYGVYYIATSTATEVFFCFSLSLFVCPSMSAVRSSMYTSRLIRRANVSSELTAWHWAKA